MSIFVVYYNLEDTYKAGDLLYGLFETYEKAYKYVCKEEGSDNIEFIQVDMNTVPNQMRNENYKLLNDWFTILKNYSINILEYELQ